MTDAYRSAYDHLVGTRLREFRAAHERAAPYVAPLQGLLGRRWARALAGLVGASGAVATAAAALLFDADEPTWLLLGSGLASVTTYVLVRTFCALKSHAAPAPDGLALPALSGEVHTDLARLDNFDVLGGVRTRLAQLERWSYELPLIATSLLTPLTLHFAAYAAFVGSELHGFSTWIRISLAVVGHAHIALAVMAVRYARRVVKAAGEGKSLDIGREWGKTLAVVAAVASLPGVLLLVVPPALSVITGLLFIPFMFIAFDRRFHSERLLVSAASSEASLPAREEEPATFVRLDTPAEPISGEELSAPPDHDAARAAASA